MDQDKNLKKEYNPIIKDITLDIIMLLIALPAFYVLFWMLSHFLR
jgi:hypothetical protein